MTSKPPKRKPNTIVKTDDVPEFPDSTRHTQLRELSKMIRRSLLALSNYLPRGEDRRVLVEFVGVIHPGAFHDPGRLPLESATGRSRHKRRENCLLAFVSKLIQDYWWLVLDERYNSDVQHADLNDVSNRANRLEKIAEKGLTGYKITGDENKGWELT